MPSTPSYMDSANLFLSRLAMAGTTEEIQKALDGMEETAQEIPAAKTILGLAYLLEGKPWYDFKRGFQAISEAAEGDEPFCWFILGSLYLNGRADIKKDPILAKYWMKRAAEKGYQDAVVILKKQWGERDSSEGFVGVLADRIEGDRKWRRAIGIGLIVLIGVVFIYSVLSAFVS